MTDKEAVLADLQKWSEHVEWNYLKSLYSPCSVLDYGCGFGFSDLYLAMNGFDIVGYDIDEDRIECANYMRSVQPEEVQRRTLFTLGDIPKREYGLVWSSHTFEHIAKDLWAGVFDKIRKACSSNKTDMLITVPLKGNYAHFSDVNRWDSETELRIDLEKYIDVRWAVEVVDYLVIRVLATI